MCDKSGEIKLNRVESYGLDAFHARPHDCTGLCDVVCDSLGAGGAPYSGSPASGTQEFEEPAHEGDTVRDVLKGLSARFPELDHALWDENARDEIGTHIEIIVNDTIMGSDYSLESQVQPGDQIILTGPYIGG